MRYLLSESTVLIDGKVDLVWDTRLARPRLYAANPVAGVALSVRADARHGVRSVNSPKRGDNSLTLDLTDDQRLAGVAFNSVGVGSKVAAAGVKVLATVVGTAARLAGLGTGVRAAVDEQHLLEEDLSSQDATEPPDEEDSRRSWEAANPGAMAHAAAYRQVADTATAKLLELRQEMTSLADPAQMSRAARRLEFLELVLADASGETAKVEGLYDAWRTSRMKRYQQHFVHTLAIDELPLHPDPLSVTAAWDHSGNAGSVMRRIWDSLGVLVEIGPVDPSVPLRPAHDGAAQESSDESQVYWREPRPARLWIWRRGADSSPVLEEVSDVLVVDRHSRLGSRRLVGRSFGEQAAELVFTDLGVPKKLVVGDKGAVGAIADAIAAAPDQFASGLDAVSKASTTLGDLASVSAEARLKAITRQVDQRTKELELEGINATAADFVELKRLKQRLEIVTAQGGLAPPSELANLQAELEKETAQRDLEAVRRQRAQDAETAALTSELERLRAEVDLMKLRQERG